MSIWVNSFSHELYLITYEHRLSNDHNIVNPCSLLVDIFIFTFRFNNRYSPVVPSEPVCGA